MQNFVKRTAAGVLALGLSLSARCSAQSSARTRTGGYFVHCVYLYVPETTPPTR